MQEAGDIRSSSSLAGDDIAKEIYTPTHLIYSSTRIRGNQFTHSGLGYP